MMYRQVEHIFATSRYVRQDLMDHYGVPAGKVTVVGTGLGVIQPFHGAKDYANGKILFAAKGRFEDKGVPMVLAAFERARRRNPALQLTIVGQEPGSLGISGLPNVTVPGFVPIEDLQRLFETHSLFLMPARNEPWGLVYLEAMACRMPIVGLNRNAFPEFTDGGKYGFGLDEADPDTLARIMVEVFEQPARLERMGAAAQAWCLEQYTWEKTVGRIVETIETLAKESPHGVRLPH